MWQIEEKAMRNVYGESLIEYFADYPDLVVLDADLSGSTKTQGFSKSFPERFFNIGIAEQNMMGIAAGLAAVGMLPWSIPSVSFFPCVR